MQRAFILDPKWPSHDGDQNRSRGAPQTLAFRFDPDLS